MSQYPQTLSAHSRFHSCAADKQELDVFSSSLKKRELESQLTKPVQILMELIFNKEMMEHALKSQHIDLEKMPLGE